MKIEIIKYDSSNLLSIRNLSSYQVVIILFIVHYSTNEGKAKYIFLDKLYFIFDLVLCKKKLTGLPRFTIPTWKVDKELKNKLIILSRNNILSQTQISKKVRYSLTEYGNDMVKDLLQIEELESIKHVIQAISKISTSDFENSRVTL
ncbi:hypothetical protein [Photobacterium iliopiscarium]|uniref:HTH marR-type domain-containing protein n=1 Tax=Photobacterium iliopiscarium TaxID=56192 RepID=A0A2T3MJ11_9GAMM|nr:hypothetical protein [Photobacterium iliopiscarium]PSV95189.1 hypothetical protein C9I88_13390 [Photobacterium iliopiscarium]